MDGARNAARPSVVQSGRPAPEAGRLLVVDLATLRREVLSSPEPDGKDLARARAGTALVSALMHESHEFGPAAPEVPSGAPLADSILGLTDEAFDAAYEILERAQEDEMGTRETGAQNGLSGAVGEALDAGFFSNLFRGLDALPASPDPSIAREFV